ncbi:MAG: hypothetical protein L0177_09040 [Chloroflexi bacterium]|nr:hypothetical protein [Chloroflexota bacterium]
MRRRRSEAREKGLIKEMPRSLRNSRIGFYECSIGPNKAISKGKYIRGCYVGVFNWDDLISKIIPDLMENKRIPVDKYPVLIISWQLRGGDPSSLGIPISRRPIPPARRKRIAASEHWEAVVYQTGLAVRVEGDRLVS